MLRQGIPDGPMIHAPLQFLSKPDIAAEAKRLGLSRNDTWSCYKPVFRGGAISTCGQCDACTLHAHAWDSLEIANANIIAK